MGAFRFPVEPGHVLRFGRAIGLDPDPAELDELVPPLTFIRAAAQFDPEQWDQPSVPGSELHAEQHYEFHRPIRTGDVLVVSERPGDTWERDSRRAGKLRFCETITEYRSEGGDLAVTARMVLVTTERPVDPTGGGS